MANILGMSTPFSSFIDPRRDMLLGAAAGLAGGGLPGMWQGALSGKALDQQAAERAREIEEQNKTAEWLKANAPQFATLPPALGFEAAMKQLAEARSGATSAPANVREWEYYNGLTPEQQTQYLTMKRANPYLDIGTGFVQPDPVNPGTIAGPAIGKDNYTPAYDKSAADEQAKVDVANQDAYESLNSKLPGLRSVVTELGTLAEKATYTTAGKLWDEVVRETGNMPTEGAQARTKYMSMVDNQVLPLLRDTFGAAFTVQEGESLRATLGAPDKTPAEKKAVLEAFIEQKTRDLEAMRTRLPSQGGADYKTKYGLE